MNCILKNPAMADVKTFLRMLPNKIVLETIPEFRGRVTKLIKHNG